MAIGLGVILLAGGLILVADVLTVDVAYVNDSALGWILILAGVLAIVISLVVNWQRNRDTELVEERRRRVE
jgi:hypothetical protein